MLKNYFKIAFRNLLRNKGFSAINILGLSIGMACAVLVLLWIENEMSHDRFHAKSDRLYLMYNRDDFSGKKHAWGRTPKPMMAALKAELPQVADATRYSTQGFLLSAGDKRLQVRGASTDSGFLNMFSFPLIQGNPSAVLKKDYSIVITEGLAKKLFGSNDVVGKTIKLDNQDNFTITGLLKDLPNNTSFSFEYLLPWSYIERRGWSDSAWGNNSTSTYVLLKPMATQAAFDAQVKNITINHTKDGGEQSTTTVFSQPVRDTWLYSKSENGRLVGGRIEIVKLFGIVALFILLIACINFMNLSTARSEKRAKEVGIRKVVGAQKHGLILQFIGESVMLAFIAGLLSLLIVQLSLPGFNTLVDKQLAIQFGNPYYWLFMLLFIVLTGIIAGSYPAFYLSSYQPVKILKGTFKAAHALITPRKVLVVLQFTFAIALIICTIIVRRQISHAQRRDEGYAKDGLIYVWIQGDIEKNYELIKAELLNSGAATGVTKSMGPITQHSSDGWGLEWQGATEEDKKVDFLRMSTDADFAGSIGVKLVQGRDIDIKIYLTDSTAMLLNEEAVKVMRFTNPVGRMVKDNGTDWHVVGVVKNFILESPYEPIGPMVIEGPAAWFNTLHIKLNTAKPVAESLKAVEKVFAAYNPAYPFDYKFVDDEYAKKFNAEHRTSAFAALFAALTIFISCLGLFGLAAYMAENRIKEIGVRKVLGATVANITALLSKDFLRLVIIAFAIASPVAWYGMHRWLQGYSYRVAIEWWVFAGAGLLSVLIAIATVSYQSIRAAVANPVKSLRSE